MKNFIFLLLTSVVLLSCNQKEVPAGEPKTKDREAHIDKKNIVSDCLKQLSNVSLERQNQINTYAFTSDACNEDFKIVIDLTPLSTTERAAWLATHDNYCDPHSDPAKQYFNVRQFLEDHTDYTKEMLSDWLKDNGTKISYPETRDYINCVHEVQPAFAEEFSYQAIEAEYTYQEIQQKAASQAPGISFATPNYKHYIKFEFDGDSKLKIEPRHSFVPDGGYYSIPLLMEVVRRYGKGNDTKFEFRRIFIKGNLRTFFSVTDSDGKAHFYDFSQVPDGISARIWYNAFSPF